MRRGILVVLVLIVLVGVLVGGRWWIRASAEQATQLLITIGLEPDRAQVLVSQLSGQAKPEEVTALVASGTIEAEEVAIVSEFVGLITGLYAEEGDEVEAGEVLVELDTSLLLAQMAQAEAAVDAAEANLANVKAGTHPAEIAAAQAALDQAIAEGSAAETGLVSAQALVKDPQELDAQIVEAQTAAGVAATQIDQAKAQLAAAEAERERYRAQGTMQEKWLYAVHNYRVEAARAAIEAAQASKEGAEGILDALKALRAEPLAIISQVHMAEAQQQIAEAGVTAAAVKLEELKAGPTAEEIAVAEAQVAQAKAAVVALQAQTDKRVLRSPISGVVTGRFAHRGEAATAGASLLTVADLDEVKLTVYIPEGDLGRVYLGQEVEIQVDSFPGRVFSGTVSHISQQAEFTPKNVQTEEDRVNMVFAVRVRLPNAGHLLKAGMPADALVREPSDR